MAGGRHRGGCVACHIFVGGGLLKVVVRATLSCCRFHWEFLLNAMTMQQEPAGPAGSDEPEPPGGADRHKAARSSQARPAPTRKTGSTQAQAQPSRKTAAGSGCRLRIRMHVDDCLPPLAGEAGWLRRHFLKICALAGVQRGQITLVVVGDDEMATLHERYTGVAGTTDVLTFDHRDDARQPIESDIILCLDTAAREAGKRKHDTRLEVLLYAVHGLNHLLGGDDHTPKGAAAMHRWEDQMLQRAGLGQVYHTGGASGQPSRGHGTAGKARTGMPKSSKSKMGKSKSSGNRRPGVTGSSSRQQGRGPAGRPESPPPKHPT